jgi:hypothetical protein
VITGPIESGINNETVINTFIDSGVGVGKYEPYSPYVTIGEDAFDRDYVAAIMQEPDGVRVYLSGVSRNFFFRGKTVEEILEVLR